MSRYLYLLTQSLNQIPRSKNGESSAPDWGSFEKRILSKICVEKLVDKIETAADLPFCVDQHEIED
jgi:hypothetical protein